MWEYKNSNWFKKQLFQYLINAHNPKIRYKKWEGDKGINLEGFGLLEIHYYLQKYYDQGADELIYIDCVASLYGQNNLTEIILKSTKDIFIPFCVGGGIRSITDAEKLFNNVQTKLQSIHWIENKELITKLIKRFKVKVLSCLFKLKKLVLGLGKPIKTLGDETGKDV